MYFCRLVVGVANLVQVLGSPTWLGNGNSTSLADYPDNAQQITGQGLSSQVAHSTTDAFDSAKGTDAFEVFLDETGNATVRVIEPGPWQFRLPRLFCNFDMDSQIRGGSARFKIDQIDASFCTDLNYDHAEIQRYHFQSVTRSDVFPHERDLYLPTYITINDLKVTNPSLRTFLTLAESNSFTFSSIVTNSDLNRNFVTSCTYNLRLWGFNGLILKWIYPSQPQYLTQLLLDLRNAFLIDFRRQKKGAERLLLGVILTGETGVASEWYEVYAISQLVDLIVLQLFDAEPPVPPNDTSILTYLYKSALENNGNKGSSNTTTNISASNFLVASLKFSQNPDEALHGETYELDVSGQDLQIESLMSQFVAALSNPKLFFIDDTIKEWTTLGADKSKLIIGLSLTGVMYHLMDKTKNAIGAPTQGDLGRIYFYETCDIIKRGTLRRVSAQDKSPYWFNDTAWISYEDMASIAQKVEYLRDLHLHGVMLFSLSEDDFSGTHCGLGNFPMFRMVHNVSRVYLSALKSSGRYEWDAYCGHASKVLHTTVWQLILSSLLYVHSLTSTIFQNIAFPW